MGSLLGFVISEGELLGPFFRRKSRLVIVVLVAFVAVLVKVMATPGTTAPLGSVTVPVIVPRDSCAATLAVSMPRIARQQAIASKCFPLLTLIASIVELCVQQTVRQEAGRAERA